MRDSPLCAQVPPMGVWCVPASVVNYKSNLSVPQGRAGIIQTITWARNQNYRKYQNIFILPQRSGHSIWSMQYNTVVLWDVLQFRWAGGCQHYGRCYFCLYGQMWNTSTLKIDVVCSSETPRIFLQDYRVSQHRGLKSEQLPPSRFQNLYFPSPSCPPARLSGMNFNGLDGDISRMIEIFITTAGRT
jgi:hypothetical protein